MGISGIQAGQHIYEALTPTSTSERASETSQKTIATHTDTVQISQEAKNLSVNSSAATNNSQAGLAGESSEQKLPVEAYALPDWYSDLLSDLTLLDDEIGISYAQSRAAQYDALSSAEKNDLAEYYDTLHTYFQEELSARGIGSGIDYYNQIILDQETSEEVHQAVKQKLLSDARAMQVMEYFGISV